MNPGSYSPLGVTSNLQVLLQNLPGVSYNKEVLVSCTPSSQTIDVIKNVIKLVPGLSCENVSNLEMVEVLFTDGMSCKERCLHEDESPIIVQRLWPCAQQNNASMSSQYKLVLRRKEKSGLPCFGNLCVDGSGKYLTGLMTKRCARDYPDLCNLPELNEITLLENLKKRFENNSIYTYIGSILISINPFYYFPIYNPKFVDMYQNKRLSDLPPHIFAIADLAYHNMVTNKKNQCIVISGESGSGKTENANFLLHHLSALSQRNFYSNGIEKHIAGVGPVLEAFGNARTVHNNNSSRFGKFVQVSYREDGTVYGATVEKYLLEKSRIVSQAACERNYHVFYYLVAGANESEKIALHLTEADDYFYLNQDRRRFRPFQKDERMEVQEFNRLKNAMDAVGFSSEVQNRLFVVLSAILHLGNIGFRKRAELGHHDECVAVKDMDEVSIVSQLLKVSEATLLDALTKRRTQAGGEVVVMSNRLDEAISTRNSTAKCLYSALFDWIVCKINALLLSKHSERRSQGNCIGVLDIFGFEDFHDNSFEQFCINYANENLHYYFNQHIFKLEQEEYTREGIVWENIEFIDNTGCLELFSKKPSGLFHLLDEESNFPGATNETLLSKFHSNHQNNAYYEVPQTKQSAFGIVHYAGKVKYSIQDFREKNIDLMRNDILVLFKSSKVSFIKELIGQDPLALMRWSLVRIFFKACYAFIDAGRRHKRNPNNCKFKVAQIKGLSSSPKKKASHSPIKYSLSLVDSVGSLGVDVRQNALHHWGLHGKVKSRQLQIACNGRKDLLLSKTPPGSRKSKNKPPSIGAQFHVSLLQLTETLNQAMPSFIRCIKSNNNKAQKTFDEELVGSQLRYTGMLATVKIRQSGYNYRQPFEDFVLHFHPLLPHGKKSTKEDIGFYLSHLDIDKNNFQLGETKVFLREKEKLFLEEKLHESLLLKIILIQNWVKTKLKRRSFLKMKAAAIVIQSHVRCFMKRNEYLKLKISCVRIQSWFKGRMTQRSYKQIRTRCTYLQECAKMYLINHKAELTNFVEIKKFIEGIDGEQERSLSSSPPRRFVTELEREVSYEMAFNVGQVGKRFRKEGKLEVELTVDAGSSEQDDTIGEVQEVNQSRMTDRFQPNSMIASDEVFSYRNNGLLHERDVSSLDVDIPPSSGPPSNDVFATPTSHPKLKSKSHSISSQAGPEDIEIEVKKVICDERTFPASNSRCKFEAFEEKEVKAPLAVEEVFSDDVIISDEHEPRFEIRTISIDNDSDVFRDEFTTDKRKNSRTKEESQQQHKSSKSHKKSSIKKSSNQQQQQPVISSWKCSSTTQWKYPLDLIVENLKQLRQLEQYLSQKMIYMGKLNKERGNKDSVYDEVFKASLTEFHTNLITQISTAKETSEMQVAYSYERLMKLVEDILRAKSRNRCSEDSMPFFINAFRGFLDEFMKKKEAKELPDIKSRRIVKKSKKETVLEHLEHKFLLILFNIPTYCEVCQSILWVLEKGYTCRECKLTIHKKCFSKVVGKCGGSADDEAVANRLGRTIIGSPLEVLTRETPSGCRIHPMIERLMNSIEMDGLYTEGLYRKAGMASAVKQLIKDINNDHHSVDFKNYPIHVLTSVLKAFFREMPEPLMTFELYQDFIRFTDIMNEKEKMRALYSLVDRLPQVNHDLLERLIFHLAKVALQEESNRMNAGGLAIIFAPSILRTRQNLPMQESLLHVPRQSMCIQFLIESQMQKMISTLRHIETINMDTIDVSDKLATLRASRKRMSAEVKELKEEQEDESGEQQVKNLAYQIKSLQRKKQELTEQLPSMSCRRSFSEDVRFSSEEGESVVEDYDDESILSSQSSDPLGHFSESDAALMQ